MADYSQGCGVPVLASRDGAAAAAADLVLRLRRRLPCHACRLGRFAAQPREQRRATYARWWTVIKKEAKHYWVGTKLLAADVKIASRLVAKVLRGRTLSRRERNQLTRTSADIFRLAPMAVFVIIPFMELLLPVGPGRVEGWGCAALGVGLRQARGGAGPGRRQSGAGGLLRQGPAHQLAPQHNSSSCPRGW